MQSTTFKGTLGALRRDKRGNTLAMAAASLIPICAMVGSGLDASRAYLAKARLQSACDAGALAARKVMDGAPALTPAATASGRSFFENNFPTGTYGSTNRAFATQLNADMEVIGNASVRVPMTLMTMFGYENMDLNVTCSARLDITNTDIMFVLDVTGSMLEDPNGGGGQSSERPTSRIVGLRKAVMAFYDTMETNAPPTARIRYGFVPYAQGVNIGSVLQPSQILNEWTYQSRVAEFTTPVQIGTWATPVASIETFSGGSINSNNCDRYGANVDYPANTGASKFEGAPPAASRLTTVSKRSYSGGVCTRNKTTRDATYVTKYRFTRWVYQPVEFDTSSFKTGSTVRIATANPPVAHDNTFAVNSPTTFKPTQLPGLSATKAWDFSSSYGNAYYSNAAQGYSGVVVDDNFDGCIEERNTVAQANITYPLPNGAYDLEIDTLPTSEETTWRAAWPEVIFKRNGSRPGYSCPKASQKLQEMTKANMQAYVNGLVASGTTWHDIGMIWGARLLSPTGLYASENAVAPNNQPISRNIIFMTDGMMNADNESYGTYGYETLDRRVTGTALSDNQNRHNSRFVAVCKAARAQSQAIRIWVIGFGTATTKQMTDCADPGQVSSAGSTAALEAEFRKIATKIAKLRLSK